MPSSIEIITGGCPAWRLPHTRECAAAARSITRQALQHLIPDQLDDCCFMVGELATNAWKYGLRSVVLDEQHAPSAGGSELAIYRRGPKATAELVVTVFDPDPSLEAVCTSTAPDVLTTLSDTPPDKSSSSDNVDELLAELPATLAKPSMRCGLNTVRALSGGRLGFYRTRSRRGTRPVPGKVAWFAIPATRSLAAQPPEISIGAADAVRALKAQLDARGLDHTYYTDSLGESVLSVRHNLTIWCRDQAFRWGTGDQAVRIPYYDLVEAVERIVEISQDADYISLGTPL